MKWFKDDYQTIFPPARKLFTLMTAGGALGFGAGAAVAFFLLAFLFPNPVSAIVIGGVIGLAAGALLFFGISLLYRNVIRPKVNTTFNAGKNFGLPRALVVSADLTVKQHPIIYAALTAEKAIEYIEKLLQLLLKNNKDMSGDVIEDLQRLKDVWVTAIRARTMDQAKIIFNKLALKYHPDKAQDDAGFKVFASFYATGRELFDRVMRPEHYRGEPLKPLPEENILQESFEDWFAGMLVRFERQLAESREAYVRELAELLAAHEQQLAERLAVYKRQLAADRAAHQQQLEAVRAADRAAHQQQLEAVQAAYEQRLQEVQAASEQRFAALEKRLAAQHSAPVSEKGRTRRKKAPVTHHPAVDGATGDLGPSVRDGYWASGGAAASVVADRAAIATVASNAARLATVAKL